MKDKEEQLPKAHTELIRLRHERDGTIDAYMETYEFVHVMRAHDEIFFPGFFRTGWNAGVRAVQEQYPEINPVEYQSPDDSALIQQFHNQASISDLAMPEDSAAKVATEDLESSNSETDSGEESGSEEKEGGDEMEVGRSRSS